MKHWEEYFKQKKQIACIRFVYGYFSHKIKEPTNTDLCRITFDELENYPISVKTMKEILEFQLKCKQN